MMKEMQRRMAALFGEVALLAASCSAQPPLPAHYVEIKLPLDVASENLFVRYALTGQDLGDWVQPHAGISSYVISTTLEGLPATGIKAILYAPGCAIRTLDLVLSGPDNPQYSFICQPLRSIEIQGVLIRLDRLYEHRVKLQARYLARWAQPFLGLDDRILTGIPVGEVANLSADGRFRLMIPDLSQDPLAGAPDHSGEIQIWAKDDTSDVIVAQLIPIDPQPVRTRMGGLNVRSAYASEIVFVPCPTSYVRDRDKIGFATRPDLTCGY